MANSLTLRPATAEDADFLWALRNDPTVAASSRIDDLFDPATHQKWVAGSIESPERRLFVICDDGLPIGQARLDAADDDEWVSIALLPKQRGRGHGREVLQVLQGVAHGDLRAEVRASNSSSLHLFRHAGFEQIGVDRDFTQLRWSSSTRHVWETQRTTARGTAC